VCGRERGSGRERVGEEEREGKREREREWERDCLWGVRGAERESAREEEGGFKVSGLGFRF
jgi:hypothetical protein